MKNIRSPTLNTVNMIEKSIEKYSGEFNKRGIWKRLDKKVMWQTFVKAVSHLEEINKIIIEKNGLIIYIWNPKLAAKYKNKLDVNYTK